MPSSIRRHLCKLCSGNIKAVVRKGKTFFANHTTLEGKDCPASMSEILGEETKNPYRKELKKTK